MSDNIIGKQSMSGNIIVGGGSAGSVLASRLTEDPEVSVLLLEAGKDDRSLNNSVKSYMETPRTWTSLFRHDVLWRYSCVEQKHVRSYDRARPLLAGKVLGGSSSINGMLYFRGNKADFDQWSTLGAEGWNYSQIFPYFLKSEDNHIPEYHNSGLCIIPKTIFGGKRESVSRAYLRSVVDRPNLHIITEAFVSKILISRRNKRAYEIRFIHNGTNMSVRPRRETIVSAGALGSPKLLMMSGIGRRPDIRSGLPKINHYADLPVGFGLQDHIGFSVDILLNMKTQTLHDLIQPSVASEYIFEKKGLLAETIVDINIFADVKHQSPNNWPEVSIFFANGRAKNGINSLTKSAFQDPEVSEPAADDHGVTVLIILLHPKSKGTVTLKSSDPDVLPEIDPKYLSIPEDKEILIQGVRRLQQLINTEAFRNVNATIVPVPDCLKHGDDTDDYWSCVIENKAHSFLHFTGTCKMGHVNDSSTVVDSRLRVKGIKDLRVVDASIIPEITSGNTNGPVIMVAEKAADIIKEDWKKIKQLQKQ
ncbi:hypothetical protein KUTeg_001639 [Tegillarca granosa]|uniref:Glucose-methanol-choline oxidoreductase N-terminal domain-containing protein n=1 Tax=Tegillarca granosa TaxID=220873 RepID=A0ABQ9FVN3_TEGGR|nr:hypothetical protein KUTeg_001639 [Tegillarca granosa]